MIINYHSTLVTIPLIKQIFKICKLKSSQRTKKNKVNLGLGKTMFIVANFYKESTILRPQV